MRRIDSDLNCSALPRYMTFINYRKWDLVGGRGGPAEQLVDSGTLFVHVTLLDEGEFYHAYRTINLSRTRFLKIPSTPWKY